MSERLPDSAHSHMGYVRRLERRIKALEDASRRCAALVEEEMERRGYVPSEEEQNDE